MVKNADNQHAAARYCGVWGYFSKSGRGKRILEKKKREKESRNVEEDQKMNDCQAI